MLHRCFSFFILILLLMISGCAYYKSTQSSSQEIVDPLIERNQQWRENVDAGNSAIEQGHLSRKSTYNLMNMKKHETHFTRT